MSVAGATGLAPTEGKSYLAVTAKPEVPPAERSPEPKAVAEVAAPAPNVVGDAPPGEQPSKQQPAPNAGQAK